MNAYPGPMASRHSSCTQDTPQVTTGEAPTPLLRALTRASTLVAEGLSEERLVPPLVRCAADGLGADLAAMYLHPENPSGDARWRLAGICGADPEILATLPVTYGTGGGILAPLFQGSREVCERDLLDDDTTSGLPAQLPVRSLAGVPIRRRDSRPIGVLLVGARRADAFDDEAMGALRTVGRLVAVGIDNARLAAGEQRERRMVIESQATLGSVLESVGSGICVVELDGTLRVANKPLQDLFGLRGQTAGVAQEEVFASAAIRPRELDAFVARLRELIADPSQGDESEWELATDPPRIVQRNSAPLRSQLGEVIGRVDVYTEITESRRLYTQLLNSEKMRAIGEMASGVAHDFNNLLASILGQVELLHPDELRPQTREAIATIRTSALDGARIVRNLQGLARPRAETPSTTADLNETVRAAVDMARPRWAGAALHGSGAIEVTLNLVDDAQLSRVAIDPAELREVLLNLLFNAADAMPEGGRIEISTRPGETPRTADLEVRDTGHGMPESVRARIFEPFFSTKGSKGSGLGLAVAYSIITRRGGRIAVESQSGHGTSFTLNLPYVPVGAPPSSQKTRIPPTRRLEPATPRPSITAILRGAHILVADDEPGLVAIVRQLMERSGATVAIAHGGNAALEALRAPGANFDVVITDLDMPDVDGWAVASAVKAHSPATYVVMLTGWAGEIAPEDSKQRGVDVVLAKPCSRVELEAAIGSLLSARPTARLDVLLVDDEAAFARAVRDLLGLQGHTVTVVESAQAALEAVASHTFDVVLTDYSLGEMTGGQLAERLADMQASPFTILITGYATEIDEPSLLTRGVNAVLPKPCRADDLRHVLSRVRASPSRAN
jgi:signal transduction histidine kinase/CheY-like chemotaxis protein